LTITIATAAVARLHPFRELVLRQVMTLSRAAENFRKSKFHFHKLFLGLTEAKKLLRVAYANPQPRVSSSWKAS
jgi:galactitol-specific phosphotransferase system IIC component